MKRRVPHYWWDFHYSPDEVRVESDDGRKNGHKVHAVWAGHSTASVNRAVAMVNDLNSGRKPHNLRNASATADSCAAASPKDPKE